MSEMSIGTLTPGVHVAAVPVINLQKEPGVGPKIKTGPDLLQVLALQEEDEPHLVAQLVVPGGRLQQLVHLVSGRRKN